MKIKKFLASTLKEATEKMKEELGKDSIILSTRIVKTETKLGLRKMFEVTAGLDNGAKEEIEKEVEEKKELNFLDELKKVSDIFEKEKETKPLNVEKSVKKRKDEYAVPQDIKQDIKEIDETLDHREVDDLVRRRVLNNLNENISLLNNENIDDYTISAISSMIPTAAFEINRKKKPYKIAFVGPTGVGKTTCIAKLATLSKIIHKLDVGIISLDTYRLGAIDQLRVFSEVIKIDLLVAYQPSDMNDILNQFRKKDIVFIDTAGRSQKRNDQLKSTKEFTDTAGVDETYLVLPSTNTTKNLYDIADRFSLFNYNAFIFTKIDEAVAFGNILNLVTKFDKPIMYLTNGQVIPDDIISADADFIAKMIFTGKIVS